MVVKDLFEETKQKSFVMAPVCLPFCLPVTSTTQKTAFIILLLLHKGSKKYCKT